MIETKLPEDRDGTVRIGLVADTHVHAGQVALPDAALDALRGVDLILHLGDMGEASVLDRLAEIAPVLATRGGDDPPDDPRIAPARLLVGSDISLAVVFELGTLLEGAKSEGLVLPHASVASRLHEKFGRPIAAVAFAATHAAAVLVRDGVLFVNPGSATLPASGPPTVAILELRGATPRAEVVELRGSVRAP